MNPSLVQELHAVAALCDDRAARLEASGDLLATRAVTATWAGPAADRFRALIVERRNELRASAAALRDAAALMRATAGTPR
ncbi:MAG TPA: hypothetical protein VHC63_02055 [Acidimicrobiales bacterium]|nr:hypothetical protein [Acidimicrobiales bacterium]